MAKYNRKEEINLTWGGGATELFLAPCEEGGVELLDYEFDNERIHKIGGGRCYSRSCSGASGAGYIRKLGSLTRVGYYRVDTARNEFQHEVEIVEGVTIMLPYMTHKEEKSDLLEDYPVVVKVGRGTIIYCDFYITMNYVLETLLEKREFEEEPRILRREFVNTNSYDKDKEEVELRFYNFFEGKAPWPWEFATEMLQDFEVKYPKERMHSIAHLSICEDGTLVRTIRIGGKLFATETLESDPCESLDTAIPGWEIADTNIIYKVRDDEVDIIAWQLASTSYQKKVERIARYIPDSVAEDFKDFVKAELPFEKYVEVENRVPKLLFFLNKEKQIAKIRKDLASRVHAEVLAPALLFTEYFNNRQILEAISDETIIKVEDSWNAGICRDVMENFLERYFRGKTEISAQELKKNWGDCRVKRVFRYVAKRDNVSRKFCLVDLPDTDKFL